MSAKYVTVRVAWPATTAAHRDEYIAFCPVVTTGANRYVMLPQSQDWPGGAQFFIEESRV